MKAGARGESTLVVASGIRVNGSHQPRCRAPFLPNIQPLRSFGIRVDSCNSWALFRRQGPRITPIHTNEGGGKGGNQRWSWVLGLGATVHTNPDDELTSSPTSNRFGLSAFVSIRAIRGHSSDGGVHESQQSTRMKAGARGGINVDHGFWDSGQRFTPTPMQSSLPPQHPTASVFRYSCGFV